MRSWFLLAPHPVSLSKGRSRTWRQITLQPFSLYDNRSCCRWAPALHAPSILKRQETAAALQKTPAVPRLSLTARSSCCLNIEVETLGTSGQVEAPALMLAASGLLTSNILDNVRPQLPSLSPGPSVMARFSRFR